MTTTTKTAASGDALEAAFLQRTAAAKAHYKAGGHVCGYFGNGMPVEVAIATGHMPMAIMPLPDRKTPFADEWVNETFDPQLRLILDHLLSGELDFVDVAVAVSQASPDSLVFQSCRELLRQGRGGQIPPLHHYSLLALQHESVREYGRLQIDALARRLRANSGEEATPAKLRSAIELTNAVRVQWRKLDGLRRRGAIRGAEALRVMAAARFMDTETYLQAVTRVIGGLKEGAAKGPKLLVISSTALGDTRLHQAIEAGGAVVVGEDDIWGAASATPDIVPGEDPMGAIYAHNYKHVPNRSVYPASVRLGWIYANAIREEVQGVVIHMPRSDRSLGWDYPRLRDYLEQHGKPYLMTRDDASSDTGAAAVTQAVSRFVARIQE